MQKVRSLKKITKALEKLLTQPATRQNLIINMWSL